MCRVESDLGPKEASIVVSVLHGVHSGPSYTPGEVPAGLRGPKPKALPGARKDAVISGRGGAIRMQRCPVTLCCLFWKPQAPEDGTYKQQYGLPH